MLSALRSEVDKPQKRWRGTLSHVAVSVFLLFYAFTDLYLWVVLPPTALAWLLPANAGVKLVSAVVFLRLATTGRGRAELGWFLWLGVEVASRLVGLVWRSAIVDRVL